MPRAHRLDRGARRAASAPLRRRSLDPDVAGLRHPAAGVARAHRLARLASTTDGHPLRVGRRHAARVRRVVRRDHGLAPEPISSRASCRRRSSSCRWPSHCSGSRDTSSCSRCAARAPWWGWAARMCTCGGSPCSTSPRHPRPAIAPNRRSARLYPVPHASLEGSAMLELIDLRRRFGDVVALDGVSFTVPDGAIVGFVGPNGAGKTTAMRIALGVLEPDEGEVRWRGRRVDAVARRRFGYMPEERGLYPKMKVHDQLVYLARLHGLARTDAERRADEVDRGARRRGPARRPRRDALPGEPAARPTRRRARARAGRSRPRRAVQRPGPGRRRRPRGRAASPERQPRCAGGLLQSPAGADRAGLRLRGPDRPGADRGVGHDRRAARLSRPAPAARGGGERHAGLVHGGSGRAPGGRDRRAASSWSWTTAPTNSACWTWRERAGDVTHFSWVRPTLAELFREVVRA